MVPVEYAEEYVTVMATRGRVFDACLSVGVPHESIVFRGIALPGTPPRMELHVDFETELADVWIAVHADGEVVVRIHAKGVYRRRKHVMPPGKFDFNDLRRFIQFVVD